MIIATTVTNSGVQLSSEKRIHTELIMTETDRWEDYQNTPVLCNVEA